MPESPDDPIRELFSCHMMGIFRRALAVHDALAAAFFERTGQVLEPDTEYTLEDLRRAKRILRAAGREKLLSDD